MSEYPTGVLCQVIFEILYHRSHGVGAMPALRVLKGHLKEKEALKKLVKRASDNITLRHLPKLEDANPSCPPSLQPAVSNITSKLMEVKAKIDGEELIIAPTISRLTDAQISSLKDIFEGKGSTEDKIFASSFIFLGEELDYIDKSVEYLSSLKADLVKTFLRTYAQEFHTSKAGSLTFNNDALLSSIRTTIDYRRGIHHQAQRGEAQPEQVEERNSCVVM